MSEDDPAFEPLGPEESVNLYQNPGTVEFELFDEETGDVETILVNHSGTTRTRTSFRDRLRKKGYDLVRIDE